MNRDEFIKIIDRKCKLIRNEYGYTQDKMSEILGISKKTLIQIEKGRATVGWTGAVAFCTLFRDSEILEITFGGHPLDIILDIAFKNYEAVKFEKTLGGRVWWKDLEAKVGYKVQQNIISQHYRIIDHEDRRICSSFDYEYIKMRLKELREIDGVSEVNRTKEIDEIRSL